ncbi:hypothetical protein F5Y08DRAFT_307588 [Xylaria arbuscula]|nr:hypothetical protein F5Y08DRAFT_307588 [Xylaria arbuscula]
MRRVIIRGDWESINIEPTKNLGIFTHKLQKVAPHSSRSKIRKPQHRVRDKIQLNAKPIPSRTHHNGNFVTSIKGKGGDGDARNLASRPRSTKTNRPVASHREMCDYFPCSMREPKSNRLEEPQMEAHTVSDKEQEEKLYQELQKRQPPCELVVPECKWAYVVKCIDNADLILDDEDKKKRTITVKTFADRQKANEYLNRSTSPETVGGIDAIVSRTSTLEGPQRLLKVDIRLSDGEHYISWVEQDMVVLSSLKAKMRNSKQWAPGERAKYPHYVVTCDLITYETCPVSYSTGKPQPEGNDDDETDEADSEETASMPSEDDDEWVFSGTNIDTRIDRLPLATFTFREMANECAGLLFLEKSKVDREIVTPEDVWWWEQHALPEHRRAVEAARRPDGLYHLAMVVDDDTGSRLGWSQIIVSVHEVPDVVGPVNF